MLTLDFYTSNDSQVVFTNAYKLSYNIENKMNFQLKSNVSWSFNWLSENAFKLFFEYPFK